MGRRLIVVGVTGVIFLLMATIFSSTIVCSQKVESNEIKTNVYQVIKDKVGNTNWYPGEFIQILKYVFLMILYFIFPPGW